MTFLVTSRPGITVHGILAAMKHKIWAFEVELFLGWAIESGAVREVGAVEKGYMATEWWWMALAPYAATSAEESD
ncbi:hypothetical protein LTR28_004101 [Elasticomyces elasticus]|nr:hypothetical protein LTR28_004101 [Elasticomyces elasticus]